MWGETTQRLCCFSLSLNKVFCSFTVIYLLNLLCRLQKQIQDDTQFFLINAACDDSFNFSSCGMSHTHATCPTPRFDQLFSEVEVHFVIHILALRVEALQDLCQHVDSLLTAQTCTLDLELLQQVFGGHWFTDQVPPDRFLC